MTVQTIPTPETTKDLIDPLDKSTNKSGFQRAHVVGGLMRAKYPRKSGISMGFGECR